MTAAEWIRQRCAAELAEAAILLVGAATPAWAGEAADAYAERLRTVREVLAGREAELAAFAAHLAHLEEERRAGLAVR